MARHRKIDIRMWGDAKFRSLSKPQPNAQTLWVYLLTGPHTTSIPGLFMAGESGLAEAMGWSLEGFRKAFQEVLICGMVQADFSARVIWIPKAIQYNPPESQNVVKSWRPYWDEIPECALKTQAYQHLKAFLEAFGEGIGEGWARVFTASCAHPSPNQEQEQELPPNPPKGGMNGSFQNFWDAYPRQVDLEDARKEWRQLNPSTELLAEILDALERQKNCPDWTRDNGRRIPFPAKWLRKKRWTYKPGKAQGMSAKEEMLKRRKGEI